MTSRNTSFSERYGTFYFIHCPRKADKCPTHGRGGLGGLNLEGGLGGVKLGGVRGGSLHPSYFV